MNGDPDIPYRSFLLRCWSLDGRPHRIMVEHVQSGARVQVRSLAAAMRWIDARCAGSSPAQPLALAQDRPTGADQPRTVEPAEVSVVQPICDAQPTAHVQPAAPKST
jgi:hypothetical protein